MRTKRLYAHNNLIIHVINHYNFATFSQAYIQYMKFARRAEGIKAARAVFKKAREDERIRYHVFVAAALMEYYCTKVGKLLSLNS